MEFIKFMVGLMLNMWRVLSGVKIDGVPWTVIIVAFLILLLTFWQLLRAR